MGQTLKKTPAGTFGAYSYEDKTQDENIIGMGIGMFDPEQHLLIACVMFEHSDKQGVRLLINDTKLKEKNVSIIHTDPDWNIIEDTNKL